MAMLAARWIIVPARPADFDIGGAVKIADLLEHEIAQFNPDVELLGVLVSQVDRRWNLGHDTRSALKQADVPRLAIEIPFAVRVGSAPRYAAPIVVLEPASRVGRAYVRLAEHLVEQLADAPAEVLA
jgi:chromosome partitioning protein